jgi:hypothetical protein
MANSTVAFGFRPLGKLGGNPAAGGQDQYVIVDNYSSSIFKETLLS